MMSYCCSFCVVRQLWRLKNSRNYGGGGVRGHKIFEPSRIPNKKYLYRQGGPALVIRTVYRNRSCHRFYRTRTTVKPLGSRSAGGCYLLAFTMMNFQDASEGPLYELPKHPWKWCGRAGQQQENTQQTKTEMVASSPRAIRVGACVSLSIRQIFVIPCALVL